MARKRANLTDLLNNLTFKVIYEKYKLIALNAFEWLNLPDGIEERHIERVLFDHGKAIFCVRPLGSYMCLEVSDEMELNVYGDPLKYRAHGHNFEKTYRASDCVIIENNKLRIPTHDFVMFYTNKIAEAERTMDVNVKSCKSPVIVACDEKDVLSFKQLFRLTDGNTPTVFADKRLNLDAISVLDTKAKFMGIDLMEYKKAVESELLTFLGVNNTPYEKRERLITDEANANNQLIDNFFELQYEARRRACDAINEKYSLNIDVRKREPSFQQTVENDVDNSEGDE